MKSVMKIVNITGISFLIVLGLILWPIIWGTQRSSLAENVPAYTKFIDVYLPVIVNVDPAGGTTNPDPVPEDADWLAYLNYYRSLGGLAPVTGNPEWAQGAWLHSRYMVKNDYIGHNEDPNNSWYTTAGAEAARLSNLVVSYSDSSTDQEAIDSWMQAPFHSVGILDPQLFEVGYGSYREKDGGFQMGGALDVLRGLDELLATIQFPITWPADGVTVPLTTYFNEYPDPLSSCSGYSSPAGLPIVLQIGAGDRTPDVTSHTFMQGDMILDHCVFDETTYANSDSSARTLGRAILDSGDAIVLIPRDPLTSGESYSVSITANGKSYSWSFSTSPQVSQTGKVLNGEKGDRELILH
jgi:uncharacterized protein YkwD